MTSALWARWQNDWDIDRSKMSINRNDFATFHARQGIGKAVAEVDWKPQACLGRDLCVSLIGRDEANFAGEKKPLEFIRPRRLAVANADQSFGKVHGAHPQPPVRSSQLFGGPRTMRLVEINCENSGGIDDQASLPQAVVGCEFWCGVERSLISQAEPCEKIGLPLVDRLKHHDHPLVGLKLNRFIGDDDLAVEMAFDGDHA